jgi:hypothetical protein
MSNINRYDKPYFQLTFLSEKEKKCVFETTTLFVFPTPLNFWISWPNLTKLKVASLWRMSKWKYSSTYCWPQHYMEVCSQLHSPTDLFPRIRALGTHCIGDCAGTRAGIDIVENRHSLAMPRIKIQILGHPTQSLVSLPNKSS